jgi:uncharacterized protein YecA (UPF0149 family)
MDTRTGEVYDADEVEKLIERDAGAKVWLKQINGYTLSVWQKDELKRTGRTKIGRNDPCPCGSGKKLKKCCLVG